jgi:hypothetical protein
MRRMVPVPQALSFLRPRISITMAYSHFNVISQCNGFRGGAAVRFLPT